MVRTDSAQEGDETIRFRLVSIVSDTTASVSIGTPSSVTVTIRGTDSAPSFGTGSVSAKTFTAGAAIAEFQVPAATGGNGGITYAASGLPAGLRFDATGTDTPGCPGTEPREICGMPTTATSGAQTVTITATDADSNTAATDRASLTFSVTVNAGASLAASPATLTEANLDGATLTVTLGGVTFAAGVSAASSDDLTVRHSSGVDRPCRVAIDSATTSCPSAANDVQSSDTTAALRAPTTCGTHSPKNAHTSSFALLSSRSTCFTPCFASVPRACARPAPIADTPSAAAHSAPVTAFASDATRAACMSPAHTCATNFATRPGHILRATAIVPSLEPPVEKQKTS